MARPALKHLAAAAALCAGLTVRADSPSDPGVRDVLSGIDFVPAKNTLDQVIGEDELLDIADDVPGDTDPGVRLRAYRALRHYPSALAEQALGRAIAEHHDASGMATLYLRSSMESLALISGHDAVDVIAPMLDHPSLDVRAAAARSLALTGSPSAVPDLRDRLTVEESVSVRLALSAAIRTLTGSALPNP